MEQQNVKTERARLLSELAELRRARIEMSKTASFEKKYGMGSNQLDYAFELLNEDVHKVLVQLGRLPGATTKERLVAIKDALMSVDTYSLSTFADGKHEELFELVEQLEKMGEELPEALLNYIERRAKDLGELAEEIKAERESSRRVSDDQAQEPKASEPAPA